MRTKQYQFLLEKYESLKKNFGQFLVWQEFGGSIESNIKGMPVDRQSGDVSLIKTDIFDGIEICQLNKPVGYLSGDYTDAIDIGEGKTAIIQCDVSGKGVSASLISIVVVSLFKSYCLRFNNWKSTSLITFLNETNTILENMKIQGRMAAIQIGIIDSIKKEYISTNAGNNIVYLLRKEENGFTKIKLPESPACGVFPTDLVNLTAEFKLSRIKLQDGDILLFPQDGFEESQRLNTINELEEFGINRLRKSFNAIFKMETVSIDWIRGSSSVYVHLDYSNDSGKLEDSLSSLLATEFLYRLKKEPGEGWIKNEQDESIPVNKEVVDALLRITPFNIFKEFIESSIDEEGNEIYTIEKNRIDPQFDDLSFMAVRVDDNCKKDFISPIKELSKLPAPNEMEDCEVKEELDKFGEIEELEGLEELEELDELEEIEELVELDDLDEVEEVEELEELNE